MTNRIISAVNSDGIFSFDSNAYLSTNSKSININSNSFCNIISQEETIIQSSKLNLLSINEPLILESKSNNTELNSSSIQLISVDGTIKFNSKQQEINTIDGNININATNGNINIGYINELSSINIIDEINNNNIDLLTQSIQLESLRKISLNSEDIYAIASDSIHFISQSGDITFGSQLDKSFIRFENDNLILNQQSSSSNRILDINVDKEDDIHSYKTNGLLIKSSSPTISSDICFQNDKKQSINMGITSSNSNQYHQYEKQLYGYQKDIIIYNYGPYYLSHLDINKSYLWDNNNKIDDNYNNKFIKDIDSYNIILKKQNSNFNIKVDLTNYFNINCISYHTYNHTLIHSYIIEIDSILENIYTFRWKKHSNNYETFFLNQNSLIKITKEPICIDNKQLKISFSVLTGYEKGDFWIYTPIQLLTSSVSHNTETNYHQLTIFNPLNEISHISTTNTPLSINTFKASTNKQSSLYIEKDGCMSINTPSLNIERFEYNKSISNIDNTRVIQSEYELISLNNGGYSVVWTERSNDNKYSNIYKQDYLSNGCQLNGDKGLINTNKNSGIHEKPSISIIKNSKNDNNDNINNDNMNTNSNNYIIVWSSPESNDIYNIYGQIFINHKKKKGFDIPISRFYNNKNDIGLTSYGLSNNTFLIVWCGEDNNVNYFSTFGIILDINGNIIKNKFQISHQNPIQNTFYPQILDIENNHICIFYHIKSISNNNEDNNNENNNNTNVNNNNENNNNTYNIYYNIIDYNGTYKLTNDIALKHRFLLNSSNSISITNILKKYNNEKYVFYISCYNNTITSIKQFIEYLDNNKKEYSINLYDEYFTTKNKVKNIKKNIIELGNINNTILNN